MCEKTDFMMDVIKRYDHYIATTNFKVGLMVSFLATVILGLTIRVMMVPVEATSDCLSKVVLLTVITTIIFSIIAVSQLVRVVFPNTSNDGITDSLIFFGDVSNCENGATGYYNKIDSSDEASRAKDLASQTYIVAGIIKEKFRVLKIASNLTMYCVLPLLAVSLVLILTLGG
ncbi:MAG: hypothetical protein HWE10_12600 [Gammaproteobacteria bacterium]|nr:hypothetical protein [Gammaproteobacteria bacterium]